MKRNVLSILALAAAGLIGCGSAQTTPQVPETPAETPEAPAAESEDAVAKRTAEKLRAAVDSPHRPEEERARDKYRHPVETLEFFGLRDDMAVLELWPGRGWYTAILAPVLAENGKLVVTNYDPNGPEDKPVTRYGRAFAERMQKEGDRFSNVDVVIVDPPEKLNLGEAESFDMALTFRNLHNWAGQGIADAILKEVHRVLKPGGILGVVDHRANPGTDRETWTKSGYIPEEDVIRLAEAAGFELVEKSEINANPSDTKDHPEGVWTLPPTLRLGDQDREKYEAIGESDRMTLKFRKK